MPANPPWLLQNMPNDPAPGPSDAASSDPEGEVIALCVRGLILFKRFFNSPAGTRDEIDAAGDFVRLINEVREKTDVGPKR